MSIDESCFSLPNSHENAEYFGCKPLEKWEMAFPYIKVVSFVETGTQIVTASEIGPNKLNEQAMACSLIGYNYMNPGMLILDDNKIFSVNFWTMASDTGADLLWRARTDFPFPVDMELPDKSYLTRVQNKVDKDNCSSITVRVIEYQFHGNNIQNEGDAYRVVTSLCNHNKFSAKELITIYHEHQDIKTLFREIK
ncbi:MAG: hypothetical protein LBQ79_14475 [Deltaproteobacteria bacterium]|jgi:hypothetical protein|nr:hypothetical protein [Deltaproteobacteria bacterium]